MKVNKFKNILLFRQAEIRRLSFSIYSKSGELETFFFFSQKSFGYVEIIFFRSKKCENLERRFDRPIEIWTTEGCFLVDPSEHTLLAFSSVCSINTALLIELLRVCRSFEFVFSPIAIPLDCR